MLKICLKIKFVVEIFCILGVKSVYSFVFLKYASYTNQWKKVILKKLEMISMLFGIKKEKLQEKQFTGDELNDIFLTLKKRSIMWCLPLLCDESMFKQVVAALKFG